MKKTVFLLFSMFMILHVFGQDSIIYRKGKSNAVQILKYDKQRLYYKDFVDPEFNTRSVDLYKVKQLYYEGGQVKPVRNNLAKAFVGLSIGSSNPASDYANTQSNNAGYAKQGQYGSIFMGVYLFKNFGLQFSGRFFNNPISITKDEVRNSLVNISSTGNIVSSNGSGESITVNYYGKWNSQSLNLDLLYTFKFGRKFILDTYVGLGIANITKPRFDINYSISSTKYSIYYLSAQSSKVALIGTIGLRFRYEFHRHFALFAGIDVMHAKRDFNAAKAYGTEVWSQSILVMNTNIGVCYLFNRKLIK